MKRIFLISMLIVIVSLSAKTAEETEVKKIAVFIPGVTAGSPIYEELNEGIREAAKEKDVIVKTIEGGFNSSEWAEKVKDIAATNQYDLIISSNSSMPQIMEKVSKDFPDQKFLCLDGKTEGNPNIYTAEYKQFDQAYMAGYMAGLVTTSNMKGANINKKVGLVIAHHYPVLDEIIIPGFKKGLQDIDPEIEIDLRIVGNWWDATKASELTSIMINEGSDVFLSISGGATQGVISKCVDKNKYVIHFDSNGYNKAPGTVIGSTIIRQKELAYKLTTDFLNGDLPFGKGETFSAKDGYIDFIEEDPLYKEYVPKDIRKAMSIVVANIKK